MHAYQQVHKLLATTHLSLESISALQIAANSQFAHGHAVLALALAPAAASPLLRQPSHMQVGADTVEKARKAAEAARRGAAVSSSQLAGGNETEAKILNALRGGVLEVKLHHPHAHPGVQPARSALSAYSPSPLITRIKRRRCPCSIRAPAVDLSDDSVQMACQSYLTYSWLTHALQVRRGESWRAQESDVSSKGTT